MSKADRGFASMDSEKQRSIASMGGRAAHAKGTAHRWTKGPNGTAAAAGRKGGSAGKGKGGTLKAADAPADDSGRQAYDEDAQGAAEVHAHDHLRFADDGNPHAD